MAKLRASPKFRLYDDNGDPASGWKIYTYEAGTSTSKDTYTDYTENTANANPVVLDSRGEADIWWSGIYKVVAKDASDVTKWTVDNYGQNDTGVLTGNYNSVKNGSFEQNNDNSSEPDDWTITDYTPDGAHTLDTADDIHGKRSLKFTSQGNGGGYAESDFFEVRGSTTVYASWMMRSSVVDVRNVVDFIWYTDAQVQISTSNVYDDNSANPTSWTEKTGSASAPATARYAKIKLTGCHSSDATSGSTWFDDVFVNQVRSHTVNDLTASGAVTVSGAFTSQGINDDADAEALVIASDEGIYTPNATGGSQGADTINAKAIYDDGNIVMVGANNLSDVSNAATSRTNLGLGALSTLDTVSATEIDPGAVTESKLADAMGVWVELDATSPGATDTWSYTSLSSTYKMYKIVATGITTSPASTALVVEMSISGTFQTTSDYDYGHSKIDNTGTQSVGGANGSDNIPLIEGTDLDVPTNFEITLFDPESGNNVGLVWDGISCGSNMEVFKGGGNLSSSASAVDGIRIRNTTGNYSGGTFYLYGLHT